MLFKFSIWENQFHCFVFPCFCCFCSRVFFFLLKCLFHFYPEFILLIFHAFFSRLSFGDCFFFLCCSLRVVEVVWRRKRKIKEQWWVDCFSSIYMYSIFLFYGVCMRLWRSDELTSLLLSFVGGEKLFFHCIIISSNIKENSLLCNEYKHTIFSMNNIGDVYFPRDLL